MTPDLILQNGRITTLDPRQPEARELVIMDGRVVGVDNADQFQRIAYNLFTQKPKQEKEISPAGSR